MEKRKLLILFTTIIMILGTLFFTKSHVEALVLPQSFPMWDKLIGGGGTDQFKDIQPTNDGGYVVVGSTYMPQNGVFTDNNNGLTDALMIKFDASGNIVWDQVFGGAGHESFYAVMPTSDGGYIAVGYTDSSANGEISDANNGYNDGLMVKFDANGNKEWDQVFGGTSHDKFNSVQQTIDGGYIVAGSTSSTTGGEISDSNNTNYYSNDGLLVKFDKDGNKQWDQLFGNDKEDTFNSVIQTANGEYIIAGNTEYSITGEISDQNNGGYDGLIVMFDTEGDKIWDKTYGANNSDYFNDIEKTKDGGYIVVGGTYSSENGDITHKNNGEHDGLLVKFDINNNNEWVQVTGGSESESFIAVSITNDDGYVVTGRTVSPISGDITDENNGYDDGLLMKFDINGNKEWDQVFGGERSEMLNGVCQTSDGGYIAAGYTNSPVSGEITDVKNGGDDGLLVKFHKFGINPIEVGANIITGIGNPGDTITVILPDESETETIAEADGTWSMTLPTKAKGGDFFIIVNQNGLTATELVVSDLNGIFTIRSKNSGLLMDVYNRGVDKGTNVIQWAATGGINQKWKFERLDNGFYKITSMFSGMSLDVYNAGNSEGNHVIQWPYHGGANQQWYLIENPDDGTITFISRLSLENENDYVLDVYNGGKTAGVNVIQWSYHGGDNQKWYIDKVTKEFPEPSKDYTGTYNIRSQKSQLLMDVYNEGKDKGTNVIQWEANNGLNQRWNFEKLENGYYKITSVMSGMSLDVYNGGSDLGNRVIQWPYHGGTNQQWRIIENDDGSISLMSKLAEENYTYYVLDVFNGGTTAGVNVIQWTPLNQINQKWNLEEISK